MAMKKYNNFRCFEKSKLYIITIFLITHFLTHWLQMEALVASNSLAHFAENILFGNFWSQLSQLTTGLCSGISSQNVWTSSFRGSFTHSIENIVIGTSSTIQQSFIEFFVVMRKFFNDATIFLRKYTFCC